MRAYSKVFPMKTNRLFVGSILKTVERKEASKKQRTGRFKALEGKTFHSLFKILCPVFLERNKRRARVKQISVPAMEKVAKASIKHRKTNKPLSKRFIHLSIG